MLYATEREKISENDVSDKGLTSTMYKELLLQPQQNKKSKSKLGKGLEYIPLQRK